MSDKSNTLLASGLRTRAELDRCIVRNATLIVVRPDVLDTYADLTRAIRRASVNIKNNTK